MKHNDQPRAGNYCLPSGLSDAAQPDKATRQPPRMIWLDRTASTNQTLREMLREECLPEGSVLAAGYQTAGRGQAGNVWESAAGQNLTFSVVLYPTALPAARQFIISQLAALSVKETLDEYVDRVTVKWPNDLYRGERKICGMLIENDLSGYGICRSLIGIGLNVNQEVFSSRAPNAVSIKQITGKTYDCAQVLDRFLLHFYANYLSLLQGNEGIIRQRYRAALYRGQGIYPYADKDGPFQARVCNIEPTGHLVLQLPDGQKRRYAFKEVSFGTDI